MALQLHVPGTAQIFLDIGDDSSLVQLGTSVDGVDISLNYYYEDIYIDGYGPKVPYDVEYFLQDAIIKMDLIWFEQVNLLAIQTGSYYLPNNPGQEGLAGDLMLASDRTMRMVIRTTPTAAGGLTGAGLTLVEPCYNFINTYLTGSSEVKYGVNKSVWKLQFRAIPGQQASGSFAALLYNFDCT
jgi:hypothetical protein